jgi:hypothetical protein
MATPTVPQDSRRSLGSRVFSRPSSTLGWVSAVVGWGTILLVVLNNLIAQQGKAGGRSTLEVAVILALLVGLLTSGVTGVIAAIRKQERSGAVLLPTAIGLIAVGNELIQGLVLLLK